MPVIRRWIVLLLVILAVAPCGAERIKDIAEIQGIRKNQLWGYGLIVGLNGTGDAAGVTARVLANVFRGANIAVTANDVSSANVASVLVTADLPPFAREGTLLDVTISSIGDATSLQGGELLITPLYGADRQVYAVAQGAIAVSGFTAGGAASTLTKNHPTVGRIPNGATVEREEPTEFIRNRMISLNLRHPDFVTCSRVVTAINEVFASTAFALDPGTIFVRIPPETGPGGEVEFVSKLSVIEAEPDMPAVVVVNERTGTVVAGESVKISKVAISHGNLSVITQEKEIVSQPGPLAPTGATTERLQRTNIDAAEEGGALQVVERSVTVGDLAKALNAMGVTPRDLIAIFEMLHRAGALQASLQVM